MLSDLGSQIAATSIAGLWREYGLAGKPGKSCRCPFHKDGSPSFSIYTSPKDGRDLWKCHAGCGHGDALDFLQRLTGADRRTCIEKIGQKAPTGLLRDLVALPKDANKKPNLELDLGTPDEVNYLSALRGIPLEALNLAIERNILRFSHNEAERAWVVTDVTGVTGQYRPLRKGIWLSGSKAKTARYSVASHPVGLPNIEQADNVIVVEGGPDLLAAHAVILWAEQSGMLDYSKTYAVGFLGATMNPTVTDAQKFEGKNILILCQSDDPGIEAASRWRDSLSPYCASVTVISCADVITGVKDLNDLVSLPEGKNALLKKLEVSCG